MVAENPDVTGGTVSVTAGTKVVTGVGTMWSTYGLLPGDMFGGDGYPHASCLCRQRHVPAIR